MQFDFATPAGGAQRIEVAGTFIRYKYGIGAVRVTFSGPNAGYIDLLPGQGVSGIQFNGLSIKDMSGAQNSGVIVAGAFQFMDDTIGGSVVMEEPYVAALRDKRDFIGSGSASPGGAGYCYVYLQNPGGSGKNVIVEAIKVSAYNSPNNGVQLSMGPYILAGGAATGVNKAGGPAPAALIATASAAVGPANPGTPPMLGRMYMVQMPSAAYTTDDVPLKRPIILMPGNAIEVAPFAGGGTITANFQWREVPV